MSSLLGSVKVVKHCPDTDVLTFLAVHLQQTVPIALTPKPHVTPSEQRAPGNSNQDQNKHRRHKRQNGCAIPDLDGKELQLIRK